MTPRFKANDFDGGVTRASQAIVATLEGKGDWAPAGRRRPSRTASTPQSAFASIEKQLPPWPMRILLGAFIFGIIGLFTFLGVMTPGMGWFLYFFLIPFWAMFPIIVLGVKGALILLGIYVVGFPIAKLDRQPPAVVPQGREGHEDQGHDDDRRHGRHQRRLELGRQFVGRRRILGRRRELRRRRRVGFVVTSRSATDGPPRGRRAP